jgi:hypothetical protein
MSWFTLPPRSAPRMHDVPPAPVVSVAALALPDPVHIDLPHVQPTPPSPAAAVPARADAGTTEAGPGSAGGPGAGPRTGSGADSGPGSGGEGSYIFPAEANGVTVPTCARGEFNIRFWVEVDGHVSRLEIDPLPRDAGCRRQMIETLKAYRFRPARTKDGRPVASIYPFKVTH